MKTLSAIWDIMRDKVTSWWLLSVCNCPEALVVYGKLKLREYEDEGHE